MKSGLQKNFLPVIILILFLALTFVSCSGPSTPEAAGEASSSTQVDEGTMTDEEIEELAEAVEEEEIVDIVDYENAVIGAEMVGFIPGFLCTDADNYIKVEVTNTSDFTWRSSGSNRISIGYHFWGQDVNFQEYDNPTRSSLPDDLKPGETAIVEVLVDNIANAGLYVLQIDIVLEGNFWLSSKDVPMIEGKVYFGPCVSG